jgi:hypothetical protein
VSAGRPKALTDQPEADLQEWLQNQCEKARYPSPSEFKQLVIDWLDLVNHDFKPSKEYFRKLFNRLFGADYQVRTASGLERDRYKVTKEMIQEFFSLLRNANIESFHPSLIINLDETGFGSSKGGHVPSRKVIVPRGHQGQPSFCHYVESHFVSALCAISLAGNVLRPGLITVRNTDHPDGGKLPYFSSCVRYSSERAFITRRIFTDYLAQVVLPYITQKREEIGAPLAPVFLMFDGHRSHLCKLLNAWARENHITLCLLPPHSSHLVQPLDKGFFRRVKAQFASLAPLQGFSHISDICERIHMSIEAASVTLIIWNSWKSAGIVPVIQDGVCRSLVLDESRPLSNPTLDHAPLPVMEGARGRRTLDAKFGILNEQEAANYARGNCPFCGKPLGTTLGTS